jgi:thioredoxin-related protein
MKFIAIFLILSFVYTIACNSDSSNAKAYKLLSGKEITYYNERKLEIPDTSKYTLLILYKTEIPIENKELLRKEVEEILATLQADETKKNLTAGSIDASHWETYGLFRRLKHTEQTFAFFRDADGKLKLIEND